MPAIPDAQRAAYQEHVKEIDALFRAADARECPMADRLSMMRETTLKLRQMILGACREELIDFSGSAKKIATAAEETHDHLLSAQNWLAARAVETAPAPTRDVHHT